MNNSPRSGIIRSWKFGELGVERHCGLNDREVRGTESDEVIELEIGYSAALPIFSSYGGGENIGKMR